jgi:predicted O-methyltransferase YrrM
MSEYQFTKDWFGWAPPVWEQLIPMLPESRAFLEIGSFEGRSTVWIVENMMNPGDWIDCVDTWEGGEEHAAEDMTAVEARFDHNINTVLDGADIREPTEFSSSRHIRYASRAPNEGQRKRVYKYKASSTDMLAQKLHFQIGHVKPEYVPIYDFIYIDGSHIAKDVLTDACMAWPLLKPKGIMVFDDYVWGDPRDILHRPKVAIDAFVNIFAEEVEVIHVGYQLVVRKKGE